MVDFLRIFRSRKEELPMNPQPVQPIRRAQDKQQQPTAEPRGHLPHLHRVRNRKPPFQLQERDVELVHAVQTNRFLTASLLKLLFPPDKAKTPPHLFTDQPKRSGTNIDRRLSKLFHYGYLQRI